MIFFLFVVGTVIGSFLNVCIYRIPREESIVFPGSHCPACKKKIAWFDNVPLISFLILRARCRACKAGIPVRYFIVELASGLLWAALYASYGLTVQFWAGAYLLSALLAISVTDLETGLIPDKITLSGIILGLVLSTAWPVLHDQTLRQHGLIQSLLGLLAGGGSLYLIGMLGDFLFKKESMGGGDIKLMAFLGTFLGLQKVFLVLFLGPLAALPFALFAKFFQKAETIPFGPYLAFAGACLFIFGDQITGRFFTF